MKKNTFLIFFLFIVMNTLNAQKVFIELKTQVKNYSELKFVWHSPIKNESTSIYTPQNNFSLTVGAALSKNIYLKTELGTNDYKSDLDIEWTTQDGRGVRKLRGDLYVNQNYIEILPEIRPFKKLNLFVNTGFGLHQIRSSNIINAKYSISFGSKTNFTNRLPKFDASSLSLAGNFGIRASIEKNIGLLFEIGIRRLFPLNKMEYVPSIGLSQTHLKLGIAYSWN